MKKILLTTTALGLLAAASAQAEGPTVTVGGYANFQVGSGSQEALFKSQSSTGVAAATTPSTANTSIFAREWHTRANTAVKFKVDGKADNGLGYGAYIELNADTTAAEGYSNNPTSRKTYIYAESGFGRLEAGSTGDAANALKVDAATFARAAGGIAGDYFNYIDLAPGTIAAGAKYYIVPGLPTAVGLPGEQNTGYANGALQTDTSKERGNANKLSYYSPRIQGLQFGLSYTPDQNERGGNSGGFSSINATSSGANSTRFVDVWNTGLNYQGQYNSIGIAAAVTGEWGSAKDPVASGSGGVKLDDLAAYNAGLNLSYAGVTVGGSYGKLDEFGVAKSFNSDGHYWTAGAAYEFGPFAASVTYFDSTIEHGTSATAPDQEFRNVSVGADYKLAPGFMPYVEVSFFDADNNVADTATTVDNNGTVFIFGTALNF